MMQFFPSFFAVEVDDGIGYHVEGRVHGVVASKSTKMWMTVFFIEHFLFIGAAAVYQLIPSMPVW